MKTNLYSIYDTISEVFNKPFTQVNDGSAIRAFTDGAKENNFAHKDDYVLYALGEFNDANGIIFAYETPKRIYTGIDIKVGSSISEINQLKDLEAFKKQA